MTSIYSLASQHRVSPGVSGAKGAFSPKHRAAEKRKIVLSWLYKWGWSSDAVFHALLGIGRKPSLRLRQQNIIQKVPVSKYASSSRSFFTLHESVLYEAMRTYEKLDPIAAPLNYPWLRTLPPVHRLGDHHEISQLIAIDEINLNPGKLASDRELRAVGPSAAHPDFMIEREGMVQWHEIELHPKNIDAMYFQLGVRNQARKEGRFHQIVWWCGSENIAKTLVKAMKLPVIPVVNRRSDGKLARSTTEEGWNPRRLLEMTRFEVLDTERGSFKTEGIEQGFAGGEPTDEEDDLLRDL